MKTYQELLKHYKIQMPSWEKDTTCSSDLSLAAQVSSGLAWQGLCLVVVK